MLLDRVEHDVIRLAAFGEVLLCVVDDPVGTERPDELDVLRVADRGDVGAEVLPELDRGGTHRTRRTVDDDLLPLSHVHVLQARQRRERPVGDCCRLLEAHTGRFVRDSGGLRYGDVLRVCTEPVPAGSEDVVTDRELAHGSADRNDLSREVAAGQSLLRSQESGTEETPEKWACPANVAVGPVDRRRMDLDEDFVVLGHGPLDVRESQNLRRPISVVDNGPHWLLPSGRWRRWIGPP